MNKTAFIIPTYPPHYNFLDFLNKLNDNLDFDIILVLSFKSDLSELLKYNYKMIYKVIVLEQYFSKPFIQMIIDKKIIITFKKYFALNLVKTQYKYCATVDSEIEFVNINNVFEKFETFCNNKKIIGSIINTNDFRHKLIKDINVSSSIYFRDQDNYNKLINITNNFNLYFWFSDIPIYDMSYIDEFFEFIKFNDYHKFIEKTSWYVFDYIPYAYFVTLFKNYSFINIKDYGLFIEKNGISKSRYKRLMDDYNKEEQVKIQRIIEDFTNSYILKEDQVIEILENFNGTIQELYEYFEKNHSYAYGVPSFKKTF